MPRLDTQGISLHYELAGDPGKPPVMLIAGLGGAGSSWGAQIGRFAKDHFVVVPDHRGTGETTRAKDGYTIAQHAADLAALIVHLGIGPTHLVGSSTGGAIAQAMALDRSNEVRSITMASSFARPDSYLRREFELRRALAADADTHMVYTCYALFLFSPRYASRNAAAVSAWIDRVAALPAEREIALKRIDMIMAHDELARLPAIRHPALVMCGDQDFCTPIHLSEEIARAMPGAELAVFEGGGHFIHVEQEERFFEKVRTFVARAEGRNGRPALRAVGQ